MIKKNRTLAVHVVKIFAAKDDLATHMSTHMNADNVDDQCTTEEGNQM